MTRVKCLPCWNWLKIGFWDPWALYSNGNLVSLDPVSPYPKKIETLREWEVRYLKGCLTVFTACESDNGIKRVHYLHAAEEQTEDVVPSESLDYYVGGESIDNKIFGLIKVKT